MRLLDQYYTVQSLSLEHFSRVCMYTKPFDWLMFVHFVIRTSMLLSFLMDEMASLSASLLTSMTNSDSLFDLMVRGLLPSSCLKHFWIIHGLNFFFFSGFILQLKCVRNFVDLFAGVSSSPDSNWIAHLLPAFSFV